MKNLFKSLFGKQSQETSSDLEKIAKEMRDFEKQIRAHFGKEEKETPLFIVKHDEKIKTMAMAYIAERKTLINRIEDANSRLNNHKMEFWKNMEEELVKKGILKVTPGKAPNLNFENGVIYYAGERDER